jgi:serine/threonine protein kinase
MASFSVPPAERASRRVGTVLAGKYGIERVIGAGGMATVYQGVHRNGRRVAIKLLHEELGIHREMRARFVREGYVANAVDHPGAVMIFDDDEADDGAPFLVMELLVGETLAERCRLRGGKLPCREVCALAHLLLDVLASAHAHGIVHRDIKPENLFLTTEGALKVLDFGVARMHDDATGSLATVTGMRIGTPAFMPPEQALGRTNEIDARTDLWAVGATMFALLAGRTVHTAEHAAELIVISATTPPRPLAEFAPDVPAEIAAIVDRAVRFKADDRWPDARDMQQALEAAHREAFGEALDPAAVGPKPVPRVVVPKTEDERETKAARTSGGSAGQPTTPAPFSDPRNDSKPGAISEPTWRSDRPEPPARDTPAPGPPKSGPSGSTARSGPRSSGRTRGAVGSVVDPGTPAAKGDPTLSPATLRPRSSSAPPPSEARPAPPPHERLPRWWPVAAALALLAAVGATYGLTRWTGPVPGETPLVAGAVSSGSSGVPAKEGCLRNADCKGPVASICRREDGLCVPLASDKCQVLASPDDVANDATVWIGAMFPVSGEDPSEYGPLSGRAVDLARRDFAEATGGLPPARPGGPKRPIGVVLCDDLAVHEPLAQHLVRDLRVPAIIGFSRSKEVMDLSSSLFLPNGVLALAANTASALRDIGHAPGEPRLVWRVTTSSDMVSPANVALVPAVIEPDLRAARVVPPGEPMRVAVLRVTNPSGTALADDYVASLRFNGKSVAENGDRFRVFSVPDRGVMDDFMDAPVLDQLVAFSPHLVLLAGPTSSVISQVEAAWPRKAGFRPRYLKGAANIGRKLVAAVIDDPALRSRCYAVDGATDGEALTKFVHHYNETFTPHQTAADATSAPYDAFYVFAYAAAALGDQPITGKALASALARLGPPGEPIDVGPGGIYKAFQLLGAGKNIDLQGAATNLDFDPETGDAGADIAVFCLAPGTATDPPRSVPSGMVFRARTKKLEGAMRCP